MEIESSNPELIYYQLDLPFGQNQVIFINDAVIESIREDRRNTHLTITYEQPFQAGGPRGRRQRMVLVVTRTTKIQDNFGRPVDVNALRPGMRVNALISSRMTFSEPPQANVFILIVNARRRQNQSVEGRIVDLDFRGDRFTLRETGRDRDDDRRDRDDRGNRIRFFVDNNTRFLDRNRRPIAFRNLRERDRVRVEYQQLQESSRDVVNIALVVQII